MYGITRRLNCTDKSSSSAIYIPPMKRTLEIPIQIPKPELDHPQANRLLLIGAVGLSLGIVISYWSSQNTLPPKKPENPPDIIKNEMAIASANSVSTKSLSTKKDDIEKPPVLNHPTLHIQTPMVLKARSSSQTLKSNSPSSEIRNNILHRTPLSQTETASASLKANASTQQSGVEKRQFRYGRLAYIRCDGLRKRKGQFPCPRDKRMEQAAWRILHDVTQCQVADTGTGHADVRLIFRKGERLRVRIVRSSRKKKALNRRALYDCVNKYLTHLNSSLKAKVMVVSFQFELRESS